MKKRQNFGTWGEKLARKTLEEKGFEFVASNYRTQQGELDLIFWDGPVLVMCEVKARMNRHFGLPREAVGMRKQQTIARVTEAFLSEHQLWGVPVRFDVVEILRDEEGTWRVEHFPHAFEV